MSKRSAFLDGILADLSKSIAAKPAPKAKPATPKGAYRVKACDAGPRMQRWPGRPPLSIAESYAGSVRMRSADLSTLTHVAGQHKGITAEGYWATALHTDKMLQREMRK